MSFLDKIAPRLALKREQARLQLAVVRKQGEILNTGYSHHGASKRKKSLVGWISKGGSPDDDITENQPTLRERSRDLYMGSPIAAAAIKTIRTNTIGVGLKLNSHIDYQFLGLSKEQAAEWERNTEREFNMWARNTNCDAERKLNFGQIQGLVILSAMMSGDVFAALPIIPRQGSTYDLRISLIESDRVCNPDKADKEKNIMGGIEVNEWGEPVRAYVAKHHPAAEKMGAKKEWVPVEFFGKESGRPMLLHIMQDVERPGQRRGVPLLAPVIEALKQITRYGDAEIMAAVVSGMFTVALESESPQVNIGELGDGISDDESIKKGTSDDEESAEIELGNGSVIGLPDGMKANVINPSRPNAQFAPFFDAWCKIIGAALETPREVLLKEFSTSYSAARGAILEMWRMIRMRRGWVVASFCQPVYEEFLTEAVLKGRVEAPGFFEDEALRMAWCGAEWHGPNPGQLDPQKEANAAKTRVEENFSTREKEASELTGMDWDRIVETRTHEEQKRREGQLLNYGNAMIPAAIEANSDEGDE